MRELEGRVWLGMWCALALGTGCSEDASDASPAPNPMDEVSGAGAAGMGGEAGMDAAGMGAAGMGAEGAAATGGDSAPLDPTDAPAMQWTYVATPGALCQDGNETGFGINPNPDSDKLILYMEGGGACFNTTTCLTNPQAWDGQAGLDSRPPAGVLARSTDNPFGDWNMVYMPYCSGDVFSGTAGPGEGYMGRPQQGYTNVGLYLEQIVPTFPGVTEVVLAGVSAGGFGSAWNGLRTQDAFGEDIPVHVLDDSGPPMGPDLMPACQQQRLAELWGWEGSLHPDCTDCDLAGGNVTVPLAELAFAREGTSRFGVLSHDEDGVIKIFLAFSQDDCANWDALFPPAMPAGLYPAGLAEIRERAAGQARFAMYEATGTAHTFLGGDIRSVVSGGVSLADWVIAFRDGTDDFVNVTP